MASSHAFLPPSGASAWVACAMWPTMNATFPQDDDDSTLEGEVAHWVASELFEGRLPEVGTLHANGFVVTEEMQAGAELYFDDVQETLGDALGLLAVVERSLPAGDISPNNWGTPDLRAYVASRRTLYVWDYKYGHRYVDVWRNWQLINYVALILRSLGVNGFEDQDLTVDLRVVQPRSYHREGPIRRWVVKASELRGYFNILRNAAEAAEGPSPKSVTGEHCEFCPGRHACEALQAASYAVVDRTGYGTPLELGDHALGLELRTLLRAKELLEARVTGLSAQVEAGLRSGRRIPFFFLEGTLSRLDWLPEKKEEVKALGELLGLDLLKPADLITPTQAIEKAGLDPSMVEQYAGRKKGVKLSPDNNSTAKKVFGK